MRWIRIDPSGCNDRQRLFTTRLNRILSRKHKGFCNPRCLAWPSNPSWRSQLAIPEECLPVPDQSLSPDERRGGGDKAVTFREMFNAVFRDATTGSAVRFAANRGYGGWKSRGAAARATISAAKGANRKQCGKTKACDESSAKVACYLCNTPAKNGSRAAFGAVPLLRVQGPSVIVMLRRRGASRGRPVIGGSLKSLAFMRECPKARSG
jgi:hypothetical protein